MADDNPFSFLERLPAEQLVYWRTHQSRAWVRIILAILPIFLMGILGVLLNYALFGEQAFFPWGLMLGLVPATIAVIGFSWMSGLFVQAAFDIDTRWNGFRYAMLCFFGRPWPFFRYPFIVIESGEIRKADRKKFLAQRHLGGPGALIVQNNNAVVLERFGKVTRVEGPGRVFLARFERIREIIDLRPQRKTIEANVFTKDGIALKTAITVRFKIKSAEPTLKEPYPVDKPSLETAANSEAWRVIVGIGEGRFSWVDGVMGNVESTLRGIIAERTLDQVYEPDNINVDPREEINRLMLERLRGAAADVGAEMIDVILGPIKPADPLVEEEWRAAWRSIQTARDRVERARGRADSMYAKDAAYAYAQLEMIRTVNQGFQKLVEQDPDLPPSLVVLKFTETLRRMAASPEIDQFYPGEAIDLLNTIRSLLRDDGGFPPGGGGGHTAGALSSTSDVSSLPPSHSSSE